MTYPLGKFATCKIAKCKFCRSVFGIIISCYFIVAFRFYILANSQTAKVSSGSRSRPGGVRRGPLAQEREVRHQQGCQQDQVTQEVSST